jgi:hypothetical protein
VKRKLKETQVWTREDKTAPVLDAEPVAGANRALKTCV